MGGSQRAGPHSPRGAALYCTVTACLVLTRQVNSTPPLLTFLFLFFCLFRFYVFSTISFPVFRVSTTAASLLRSRISQRLPIIANCFFMPLKYSLGFVCFCYLLLGLIEKEPEKVKGIFTKIFLL